MSRLATLFVILTVGVCGAAADGTADLDVTRIALFNSGVGYFECASDIAGNATAELKFRTDQINDILKSLVVQDFGGGAIGVVSYASRDPIEKTLRSFGVDLTGRPTLGKLLDQLRGEPVEIGGARKLLGLIVGVEEKQILSHDGQTVQAVELLTVLTDGGLNRLPLTEIQAIKLTNAKVDAELRKALATLAQAHDADKKSVLLSFEGQGSRRVRVAYLLEAPIWKTSYRLVLADDKPPFLQGWATVENATEEDWNNVRLSLVSGRPISFRMDLYTPIYIPRPLEQLDLYASLRPPEYEGGVGGRGEPRMAKAMRRAPEAPADNYNEQNRDRSFALYTADEEAMDLDLEDAGVASVATAQEAGELFEYVIDTPVSIPRQHSAMLPIVNEAIEGRKVSIFNAATHPKHPLNGLELTNATDLNLMQGPVTLFDGNVYAGDAKLPDLKPGEQRLIAYALDLATEVIVKHKPTPDELISVSITKGVLSHYHKYVDQREYLIKNKADKQRAVILEQRYSDDWKLVTPKEPYERTRGLLRFKLSVPAQETVSYPVQLERIGEQSLALLSTGVDDIRFFLRATVISPELRRALERVVALRTELSDLSRQRGDLEKALREVVEDQARIRENLRTLQKNTDTYQRQIRKFDELETRIEQLRNQIDTARRTEAQKRQELENYLLTLTIK